MIFRAAEQRLKMRKWEIGKYTLTQLLNALNSGSQDDESIAISSLSVLDDLM